MHIPNNHGSTKNTLRAVVAAGLVAGILDVVGAIINFLLKGGKDPVKIFNFIASGVFGRSGLTGGLPMAFLGLVFHLIIATIWTYIFFYAYSKINVISKNWWLSGLGYGIVVWCGMNLIVVPLSRTPPLPSTTSGMLVGMFILMTCIGLPIAYFAKKHYK